MTRPVTVLDPAGRAYTGRTLREALLTGRWALARESEPPTPAAPRTGRDVPSGSTVARKVQRARRERAA